MDVSNIIIGACLSSFSRQLDLDINQAHPVVLGQHINIADLFSSKNPKWKKALTIEISFAIENVNVTCDLLILFTEDCIDTLRDRISYIV
jgi:chemotaxis protein CheY-P-specific phosphatase CheC